MLLLFDTHTLNILDGSYFNNFTIVDVEEGKEVTIFKTNQSSGEFPIRGIITSIEGDVIHFKPHSIFEEKLDDEVTFKIGEITKVKDYYGICGPDEEPYLDTIDELEIIVHPIEYMFDCEEWGGIDAYKDLYNTHPEIMEKWLPVLLKKGNPTIVKNIYQDGLFGVKKDLWETFMYAIDVNDKEEFEEWKSREDVQKDLELMGEYVPNDGILNFQKQEVYWAIRYEKDHQDKKWLDEMIGYVEWILKVDMHNGVYYNYCLAIRDLVKGVVEENRYDEYDQKMIHYPHSVWMKDDVPLWLLWSIYLELIKKKDGKYVYADLMEDDHRELVDQVYSSFTGNLNHFNREKAMALLIKTHYSHGSEEQRIASKIIYHYKYDY